MTSTSSSWSILALAATLALPGWAGAETAAAQCSVAIDSSRDGNLVEAYRKDFVVDQAAAYVDDFSTPTRSKRFTARLTKSGGELTVAIDYFSDVGVFHAVGFNAPLTIHGGGLATAEGSQLFATSTAVTPPSVAGNHTTRYSLTCRKV